MRKFTVSEVASILSDEDLTWQYQDWRTKEWVNAEGASMLDDGWYEVGGMRFLDGDEWVHVESVTQVGGGEGSGEYTYVVIRVGDQLFRQEGYYASHWGTDWDGAFEEVEEYEKTVKDYRPV